MVRVRRPFLAILLLAALAPAVPARAAPIDPPPVVVDPPLPPAAPAPPGNSTIAWRHSRALGAPWHGRLGRGVQLPPQGTDFWTYDWGTHLSPNRPWRRWGTDRLVRTLLDVLAAFRAANPTAPRIGVADLSRRRGGPFGPHFGGLGHASHQNGLDVDVLYPRTDRLELRAWRPDLVDRALSQDLVDRFVAAGARYVFTGASLGLTGPRDVVVELAHHDDHMHVRIR
jgi:murein endopeptidase